VARERNKRTILEEEEDERKAMKQDIRGD